MPAPRTVQFRTVDEVVSAYMNADIPCFVLWCGSDTKFPYEPDNVEDGAADLKDLLEGLKKNSSAIYTLRLYKHMPDDLDYKSPFYSSWNLQLRKPHEEGGENYVPRPQGYYDRESNSELLAELKAIRQQQAELQKRLDEMDEDDEDDEDLEPETPGSRLGMVGAVMDHPLLGPAVLEIIKPGSGKAVFDQAAANQAAKVAGVPEGGLSADQEGKLNRALGMLKKVDAQLGDHLLSLATYAEKNQPGYAFLVQGLVNLK